jgi:uncharacterized membrane protein
MENTPLITNDAAVLALLIGILAFVFVTSDSEIPFFKKFYKYVPSLLLCYFIPSVFNSLGIISGEQSKLYFIASQYLLPVSLVFLTLSIDMKGIVKLGSKAVIMFLAGTFGVIVGGPLAILIISFFSPETVGGAGPDAVWRGMSTIAGSWIGGGANQTAMKEVFQPSDALFSAMIAVDVIVANIWMAVLLFAIGNAAKVDKWLKSDTSAIDEVRIKIETYSAGITKNPNLTNLMVLMAVGFGATGFSHICADVFAPWIAENAPSLEKFSLTSKFFWIVVVATTVGLILSFTKARDLEGYGASKMGSLFLYVLVATIGMKMNVVAIFDNPGLFLVGIVWMAVHSGIIILVAKLIKAPLFFAAVGSQANIGGAASAPVVATAYHPSLAPVGVLLAVLGYALGTYGAYLCGILMQIVSVN